MPIRPLKGHQQYELLPDCTVLQLTTTGPDAASDEILDISIIKIRDGFIKGRAMVLVKPEQMLSAEEEIIFGYSNQLLQAEKSVCEVLPDVFDYLGDDLLVGVNIETAVNFLYDLSVKYGLAPLRNSFLDILSYCKGWQRKLDDFDFWDSLHEDIVGAVLSQQSMTIGLCVVSIYRQLLEHFNREPVC